MLAITVYILCAATSGLCAALLYRGYRKSGVRLLFWSSLCFAGLAVNNLLLVVHTGILPSVDLSLWRTVPAVLGAGLLVYGLVWETQ